MTARFAVFELVAREALRLGSARVRQGLRVRELWLVADGVAIDDVDDPSLRAALLELLARAWQAAAERRARR